MTALREDLADATRTLAEAGVNSPRVDAEELAAHVLGVRRGKLTLAGWREGQRERFRELVERRAARVPLQHLVGRVGFRHLDLLVGPGVFVPRPETESVVQWALDALSVEGPPRPLIVDLCAGAGTIALAVAQEAPGACVHAVEVDPGALAWARRNVEATGLPITLYQADVATALPGLAGHVDLVASNPPYVAEHEAGIVDPEVREHDPAAALWAGPDGLDVIRMVERAAARLLRPGGLVVVEHSDRQGETAPAVFRCAGGWVRVADHRDLAGRDRFVTARRAG